MKANHKSNEYIIHNESIPEVLSSYISDTYKEEKYLNVDVTDDPRKIVWSELLTDPLYAG